jgi:hypothetical protein
MEGRCREGLVGNTEKLDHLPKIIEKTSYLL